MHVFTRYINLNMSKNLENDLHGGNGRKYFENPPDASATPYMLMKNWFVRLYRKW